MKKISFLVFLLLFSLQATPSYTLELKLKIPKDLKKLGDKVKEEIGKKKKNTKKEEVKKEEAVNAKGYKVLIENIKPITAYGQLEQTDEKVVVRVWTEKMWWHAFHLRKRTITSSKLPSCKANSHGYLNLNRCYGYNLMDQGEDGIYGNDEHHEYEGEFRDKQPYGKGRYVIKDKNGNIIEVLEGIWEGYTLVSAGNPDDDEIHLQNAKKEQEDINQRCENYKLDTGNYVKKETFGGYKDFYFGMKKIDALNFIECNKPSYFFNLDKDCENIALGAEKCDNPFYGQRGVYAEGLYKFGLGVEFENEKVNKVRLNIIKEMRKKRVFYTLDSGINEFENLRKSLSKKYKLLIKPSKTSIEKYNTNDYGGILNWVYQSEIKGNLILLVLDKRPIQSRFLHSGEVHYLSKELSEIYSAKIDSKTVKTDDL